MLYSKAVMVAAEAALQPPDLDYGQTKLGGVFAIACIACLLCGIRVNTMRSRNPVQPEEAAVPFDQVGTRCWQERWGCSRDVEAGN